MLTLRGEHFYFIDKIGVASQIGVLLALCGAISPSPGPRTSFRTPWRPAFRAEKAFVAPGPGGAPSSPVFVPAHSPTGDKIAGATRNDL